MIGHGVDIIKIDRLETLKNNDSFMKKIFTLKELGYIEASGFSSDTVAGLYAVKEAFLKAIKKGINDYALTDIEVLHDANKAPYIELYNDLKVMPMKEISVSISHDGEYAIASVVILF